MSSTSGLQALILIKAAYSKTKEEINKTIANGRRCTLNVRELQDIFDSHQRHRDLEHLALVGDYAAHLIGRIRGSQGAIPEKGEQLLPSLDKLADELGKEAKEEKKTKEMGGLTTIIDRCIKYLKKKKKHTSLDMDMDVVRLAVSTYRKRCDEVHPGLGMGAGAPKNGRELRGKLESDIKRASSGLPESEQGHLETHHAFLRGQQPGPGPGAVQEAD
ncbi:hypothetical protein BDW68DRAFT_183228 [Aspergillus falconensis]